jgi:hypothetical protein
MYVSMSLISTSEKLSRQTLKINKITTGHLAFDVTYQAIIEKIAPIKS